MNKINIEKKWTEWWNTNAPIIVDDEIISEKMYWLVKKAYEFGLKEGRHLTSHSSRAAGACAFRMSCNDFKTGCAKSCLRYRLPPT